MYPLFKKVVAATVCAAAFHAWAELPRADVRLPTSVDHLRGPSKMPLDADKMDTKRFRQLDERVGVKGFHAKLCMAVAEKRKPAEPMRRVATELERLLYVGAGVDPAKDDAGSIARKMQQFWAANADLLQCSELYVPHRNIFKGVIENQQDDLVYTALEDWQLPADVFNGVDTFDGHNVMDFIAVLADRRRSGRRDLEELYRTLWAAGARPSRDLMAQGKIETPEQAQRRVLARWLEQANNGDIHAMRYLSSVYRRGQNVPADPAQGMRWWKAAGDRAIETRNQKAMLDIGTVYLQGEMYQARRDTRPGSIQPDVAQALQWFERAVALDDNKEANFWLGKAYLIGAKDPRRAAEYLRKAHAIEWTDGITNGFLAHAYIDLGEREKAAYHLRALPLEYDVKDTTAREWFKRLNVSWCGPRPFPAEIKCDGTNFATPGGILSR